MKTDSHNKYFALSLVYKWRLRWTRKWPIGSGLACVRRVSDAIEKLLGTRGTWVALLQFFLYVSVATSLVHSCLDGGSLTMNQLKVCTVFSLILFTTVKLSILQWISSFFFCHKTAFDIPSAKKVTFFSRILNWTSLVLCFVLFSSRWVIVSCRNEKRKKKGYFVLKQGGYHVSVVNAEVTHFTAMIFVS